MTDIADTAAVAPPIVRPRQLSPEAVQARLRKRYAAERRFKAIGLLGVLTALGLLALLLVDDRGAGLLGVRADQDPARHPFRRGTPSIPMARADPEELSRANYAQLIRVALAEAFPDVEGRSELRALRGLISSGAPLQLRDMVLDDPEAHRHRPGRSGCSPTTTSISSGRAMSTVTLRGERAPDQGSADPAGSMPWRRRGGSS